MGFLDNATLAQNNGTPSIQRASRLAQLKKREPISCVAWRVNPVKAAAKGSISRDRVAASLCFLVAILLSVMVLFGFVYTAYAADASLQAGGASFDGNGKALQAQTETSLAAQATAVSVPAGAYALEPLCAPGSCLDVQAALAGDGANVQIYEANGTDAQTFNIISTGGNTYKIQAQHSGKVLDVAAALNVNGTNVQQYADNGSSAQQWTFEPAGNGYYYILNANGKALDVAECGYANGTNVQIWDKNPNTAQKWRLIPKDKNAYYAILKSDGYLHRTNSTHSFDYGYKWGNSYTEMEDELDKATTLFIDSNVTEIGTVRVERYNGSFVKTENTTDTVRFHGDWGWIGPHYLKTVEFLTANGKNSCRSIGAAQPYCFNKQTELTAVKNLDKTQLTAIPYGCFYGCTELSSIAMPSTATSIKECAFYGCSKLASVKVGKNVSQIKSHAFELCTALAQIDLPKSVKSVESDAFKDCTKLTRVIMRSPTLVSTGGYVFSYDNHTGTSSPMTKSGTKSYIYVPNALLSSYTSTASSNKWGTYREHFRPFYAINAIAAQAYTGKAIRPAVTVTYLGGKLGQSYYSVAYSNNVKPGTAKATVTLKNGHSGMLSRTFKIAQTPTPSYKGATSMPVSSKATWTLKNCTIKVISGKDVVSVKGNVVTAKKAGFAKVGVYNKLGTRVATRSVTVYKLSGKYLMQSCMKGKSGMCLDMNGASKANGAQMIVWGKNGGKNQQFTFAKQKDGSYVIKSVNSGKVLDVNGASKAWGQNVIQWKANGGKNQRWRLTVDASNRITFTNVNSGLVFDVSGGKADWGANMIQWGANGGPNQKWKLVKV